MKNNQGQVLIMFILLIPVFLLFFAITIDLGLLYCEDKRLESVTKESVSYGLENLQDLQIKKKINELIDKNISNINNVEINIEEDYLQISVTKNYKGLFVFVLKNNIYELNSTYYGYISDGEFVINKE